MNTGTDALDISGCSFTNGITFTFPPDTILTAGQRIIIPRKPSALALRSPGVPAASVLGPYSGNLDNAGERITLRDAAGERIVSFVYDDAPSWPTFPDGTGPSLVLIRPTLDPDIALNWRASTSANGNPAAADSTPFTGTTSADADHDGLNALLEYALGTSDSSASPFDGISVNPAAGTLTLDHADAADDVELTVEVSPDLSTWDSNALTRLTSAPLAEGRQRTSWQIMPPLNGASRLYIRARAALRP
jgi:hypothetical protein